MLDEKVFTKGMALLSAAYPDYSLEKATMEVYRQFLSGLTSEEFEAAVYGHIKKRRWFPKVAELLGEVQSLGPSAIEVWNKLIEAAEDDKKPEMDAATQAALDAVGGWDRFGITPYDELNRLFKHFKEVYQEKRRVVVGDGVGQVPGRPQLEE